MLVRNAQKARNVPLPEGAELTTDPALLTDDPDIDVLVELIGGIDQARALIDRALDQGKHIVTANKALLAEEGLALFQKAERKKRILRYEASVAGAIPIVQALKESLTEQPHRVADGHSQRYQQLHPVGNDLQRPGF